MSRPFDKLGIGQLSVPERLALIDDIWESLAESPQAIVLSDAQIEELDRRMELHAANPQAGSTWEEVEARIRRRRA